MPDRAELESRARELGADTMLTTVHEAGVGELELWSVEPSEATLRELLTEIFEQRWEQVTFGPLIQGGAWECRAVHKPRLSYTDGYLTVQWESSHFHLCIGEHSGDPDRPTPEDLVGWRRTSRSEFFRRVNRDETPDTWGIRLFNGRGEQTVTILLPNPFVSGDDQFRLKPDWSQLDLWDHLRMKYLGLQPDARDRSGSRMVYP
jgi:hypothetical protein